MIEAVTEYKNGTKIKTNGTVAAVHKIGFAHLPWYVKRRMTATRKLRSIERSKAKAKVSNVRVR